MSDNPTVTEAAGPAVVVDPAAQARNVLTAWAAHHEPGEDPTGWDVTDQDGMHVFAHPTRARRYVVSGRCVAVCGATPDAVLEAVSWLR